MIPYIEFSTVFLYCIDKNFVITISKDLQMYKVNKKDYSKILKIISTKKHSIFPATVCEGNNQGWIYADNLEEPKSALVYTNYLGGTLVGNHNNKDFINNLKENLDKIILPEVKLDNDEEFNLSGDKEEWDPIIKDIFSNKQVDIQPIKRFEYIKSKNNYTPFINKEFVFKEINLDLLNDSEIENIHLLNEEIDVWFKGKEDFIENNFGFVALKDNMLCGWCIGVCKHFNKVEIAIETIEQFQKNGIATILSHLFIEYCNNSGLIPEWECMDWNKASELIALKLGFIHEYNYNLYSIEL